MRSPEGTQQKGFWEVWGVEGTVTSVAYRDLEITSGAIQ